MRDYRDAKIMAETLRNSLQAHGLALSRSQSLELTAKAFGLANWNVLAAMIEAARRPRPGRIRWPAGHRITVRHVRSGKVTHASAALVVEDKPHRLVIYSPLGSDMRGSAIDWASGRWEEPRAQRRHTTDALTFYLPGEHHSVTAMFHGGGGPFICWYVDMLEPFRRVPDGVVTCDQHLDIVIGPDRRWRWKDEDHLARSVELGWMTEAQALAFRREGQAVIEAMQRGASPFGEPWPDWRADPIWPIPDLPPNWANPPEYG